MGHNPTKHTMLAAVICCLSVLCTTSLASFGMDLAAAYDNDVVRLNTGCLLFHEFFAALAVLVSIVYYAIVKFSLLAMGAVLMTPPKKHPIYYADELSPTPSEKDDDEIVSVSSSSSDECIPSTAPRSDSIEEVGNEMVVSPKKEWVKEKFNAVKIWTNIYGLSVGIYCLVYSLMLPNELSAFVFCVSMLIASIYEWVVPCMNGHLGKGDRCKQCIGLMCIVEASDGRV